MHRTKIPDVPGVGFGRGFSVGLDVGSGVSLAVGAIIHEGNNWRGRRKQIKEMVMRMINAHALQGMMPIQLYAIILVLPGVGFGRGIAVGSLVGSLVGSARMN